MPAPILHSHLQKICEYDSNSGNLLWLVATSPRAKVGAPLGGSRRGYRYVTIGGRIVPVHYLVWFYCKGVWPSKKLGFADGNRANSHIDNLVELSTAELVSGSKLRAGSKSGIKGISWDSEHQHWQVHLYANYKSKAFGSYKSLREAKAALKRAKKSQLAPKVSAEVLQAAFEKSRCRSLWLRMRKWCGSKHGWWSAEQFASEVGAAPSRRHKLVPLNATKLLGPHNWRWVAEAKPGDSNYKWTARDAERNRAWRLQRNFGITSEQYDWLFEQQGGVCAVCNRPETRIRKGKLLPLCVDHDHLTGTNRGLLCITCNQALGCLRDDPRLLVKAAAYVRKWRKRHAKRETNIIRLSDRRSA